MMYVFVFGLFFSFALILQALLNPNAKTQKKIEERLNERLTLDYRKKSTALKLERRDTLSTVPALDQFLQMIRRAQDIKIWIKQSGLPISTGALVLITLLFISASLFVALSFANNIIGVLLIAAGGSVLPIAFVRMRRRGRMKSFSKSFPDAISKMASSLRAGYSLQMALEALVTDSNDLLAHEFREVVAQMEIGQSFETALMGMLERIDTTDLRLFIASVSIQRESGGNLTEILDNLETTIRERFQLQQELEAASAQGKLSGMVLSGLPIFVGVAVYMINHAYMNFFFIDPVGKNLFWASVAGQIIGFFAVRKIVQIDM